MPVWPGGAAVAVSLTFDVDAEAAWLGQSDDYARRLSTLSAGRYGIVRGLPRLLELLDRLAIPATFYVPGDTAERHPQAIRAIAGAGHEIAHHGHHHLRPDHVTPSQQRREIEHGLTALETCVSRRPSGYRSPAWELTPETFDLLIEHGFHYDSSCMGDDRPYLEEHNGTSLLELPVHWSLDDWPHFGWTVDHGGNLNDPSSVLDIWLEEFDQAASEHRHITYTMHPEVIGRPHRITALERFLSTIRTRTPTWFATHHQLAQHIRTQPHN